MKKTNIEVRFDKLLKEIEKLDHKRDKLLIKQQVQNAYEWYTKFVKVYPQ